MLVAYTFNTVARSEQEHSNLTINNNSYAVGIWIFHCRQREIKYLPALKNSTG